MYSPKIKEDLIPKLFQLSVKRKIPMTRLVDGILRNYLQREGLLDEQEGIEQNVKSPRDCKDHV